MKLSELKRQAAEFKRIQEELATLEAQKKAIALKIQKHMGSQELLEAGDYTIHWTKVVSNKLDTNALKTEQEALYKKYVKQTESRRFTLS